MIREQKYCFKVPLKNKKIGYNIDEVKESEKSEIYSVLYNERDFGRR